MASTKTELNEFLVDELETTPVLLEGTLGTDFLILRVKTTGTNCKIRSLIKFETDDMQEVDVAADGGVVNGIIPDSTFNRRQISIYNTSGNHAKWTYDLVFQDATEIEIIIPIKPIIVSLEIAASQALNLTSFLKSAGSGLGGLAANTDIPIGYPLASVSSGTGTQIIAAVLQRTSGVVGA